MWTVGCLGGYINTKPLLMSVCTCVSEMVVDMIGWAGLFCTKSTETKKVEVFADNIPSRPWHAVENDLEINAFCVCILPLYIQQSDTFRCDISKASGAQLWLKSLSRFPLNKRSMCVRSCDIESRSRVFTEKIWLIRKSKCFVWLFGERNRGPQREKEI